MARHSAFRIRITYESYVNFLASIRTLPDKRTARPGQEMGPFFSDSDLPGRQLAARLPASPKDHMPHNRTKLKQWKLR